MIVFIIFKIKRFYFVYIPNTKLPKKCNPGIGFQFKKCIKHENTVASTLSKSLFFSERH